MTDKIISRVGMKFTGRVLMFVQRGRRVQQAGVARNQVRAFARQLGDDVLVEQRVAHLDDARARGRARAAPRARTRAGPGRSRVAKPLAIGRHCHLLSFFIDESTLSVIWPFVKNGQSTGL